MAEFLSKCDQLLKLLPEMQCHKCKAVPGPNVDERNRYKCTNVYESHTLCEEHKDKCPCGSMVGKCPSPMISKLLGGLPWICKNYRYGCREIKIAVEDLEYHQRNCIYRPVFCPRTNCRDKFALFKVHNTHFCDIE